MSSSWAGMDPNEAYESVLLGESLADLSERHVRSELGVEDAEEARERMRELPAERVRELRQAATRFVGQVCRLLGERHSGEERVATLLRRWAERSKDYDAFDALLCHFEFAGREQVLAEGRRLFPGTLTAHW